LDIALSHARIDPLPEIDYDERYLEGIRCFNAQQFFEAHEVWEEVWKEDRSPTRRFYQGLIQVAVCLYHFSRGNTRGARKLYHSSRAYLQAFRPKFMGLDVAALLDTMAICCQDIAHSEDEFPRAQLDCSRVPKLKLEQEPPLDR
jgi:predicted metal-dependent hydrolase